MPEKPDSSRIRELQRLAESEDNVQTDSASSDQNSSDDDEAQEPQMWWETYRWAINGAILTIYFLGGVIFVSKEEGWGYLTSVYVIIQILTTVGYGDVTVEQKCSEWFMIFYVFIGLLVCANIVNDFIDRNLRRTSEAMRHQLREIEAMLRDDIPDETVARKRCKNANSVIVALVIYFIFNAMGTIFFATYEACSCSYGKTRIEGCVEERCSETGGKEKDFTDALYMSVITLSTTGFGDYSPKTKVGRAFSIVWMTFGVLSWVNLVSNVVVWWRSMKQAAKRRRVQQHLQLHRKDLLAMDEDRDGAISRSEFRVFFLLKEGMVKLEDIRHVDAFFDQLDSDDTGYISPENMERAMQLHRKVTFAY